MEFGSFIFMQARQAPDETLNDFYAKLGQVALVCNISDLDLESKTQIVQY